MDKVYICSPLSNSNPEIVESNKGVAKEICKMFINLGFIPIAPHIYFTQFLNDNDENQRLLGMQTGLELLKECKFMYIFDDYKISNGMRKEINYALEYSIPMFYETYENLFHKYVEKKSSEDKIKDFCGKINEL